MNYIRKFKLNSSSSRASVDRCYCAAFACRSNESYYCTAFNSERRVQSDAPLPNERDYLLHKYEYRKTNKTFKTRSIIIYYLVVAGRLLIARLLISYSTFLKYLTRTEKRTNRSQRNNLSELVVSADCCCCCCCCCCAHGF